MSIPAWRKKIIKHSVSTALCPFCGEVSNFVSRPGGAYSVTCGNCGARGPVKLNQPEALEAWEGELKE